MTRRAFPPPLVNRAASDSYAKAGVGSYVADASLEPGEWTERVPKVLLAHHPVRRVVPAASSET